MFSRASDLAHVCLRCQRRLVRQTLVRPPQDIRSVIRVHARHQSAATARVVEDDPYSHDPDESENGVGQHEQPLQEKKDGLAREEGTFRMRRSNFDKSMIGMKRFIPHESALLGMDFLGKPAEVLILPSRDRHILRVPEGSDQGPNQNFYESLASEREPLSWEQLSHNIDQAREALAQKEGQLTSAQYGKLVENLRNGFKRSQLEKYVWTMQEQTPKPPKILFEKGKAGKRPLIEYIARDLWGYTLPANLELSSKSRKVTKATEVKQIVRFRGRQIPYRMLQQLQYRNLIRNIALSHGVEATFVPEHFWVVIKGHKDSVAAARREVIDLKTSFKTTTLDLGASHSKFFKESNAERTDALLQSLSSKYGVPLRKVDKGKIEVTYSTKKVDVLELVKRDLRLSLVRTPEMGTFTAWTVGDTLKNSVLVPYQPVSQISWSNAKHIWHRLYPTTPSSSEGLTLAQMDEYQKSSYTELSKKISDSLVRDRISWPVETSNSPQYEYSARFGTALLAGAQQLSANKKLADIPALLSTFVDDIPLLPQFLNSLKPWTTGGFDMQSDKSGKVGVVARLVYRPLLPKAGAPPLEVHLIGEDEQQGFHQNLRFARVTAILEEKSHFLLLPDKAVDVSFAQQLKQDIFMLRSPKKVVYPKLLKALADHLSKAQKTPETDFAPFVRLPAPNFSWQSQTSVKVASSVGTALQKSSSKSQDYMLTSVELVDSQAYRPPLKSRLALEYASYQGGRWGPDREELRLSEVPILFAPHNESIKFHKFFHAAMDVAEKLNITAGKLGTWRKS